MKGSKDEILYLGLVPGRNSGWGVCNASLIRELGVLRPCRVLDDSHRAGRETRLGGAVLHEIRRPGFRPTFDRVRGTAEFGYTFFESELNARSVDGAQRFARLLVGSTWCLERMREQGIENGGVVLQGIDPGLFRPAETERRGEEFVLFSGGKLEFRKGQDLVLRAFRALQDRLPDLHLVTCWASPYPDSPRTMTCSPYIRYGDKPDGLPWIEWMDRVCVTNGIDPRRVRHFDQISHDSMREIYLQTDLGVFPSRCESGTNLVMMEYMACGRPAIASNVGGHRDVLTAANSILLEDLSDIEMFGSDGHRVLRWQEAGLDELIAAIEYAHGHRESLRGVAARGAEDMKARTWERTARDMLAVIEGRAPLGGEAGTAR